MRVALWLALLAVPSVGGAWIYARLDLDGRIARLENRLHGIEATRQGRLPKEDEVTDLLERAAAEIGLRLRNVAVSLRPVTPEELARIAPARALVEEVARRKVEDLLARRVPGAPEETPTAIRVPLTLLEVRLVATGRKWLWSLEKAIVVRKTFRGTVAPAP